MKETINPLYRFLNDQSQAFKKEFQIQARSSLDNGPYYKLSYPVQAQNKISTHMGEFTPSDAHISIYEEDKKEMAHSAFHLTVYLRKNVTEEYCAHIFYTLSGDYLFSSFRDGLNNFYELESKEGLLSFGRKNIQNFLAILSGLQQNYNKQYSVLVNKANNLSKLLDNNDAPSKKNLVRYKHSLEQLITFIKSGTLFNQKYLTGIHIHESLLEDTQQKLDSLQSAVSSVGPVLAETTTSEASTFAVVSKSVEKESTSTKMDELNKKIAVLSRNKKNRSSSLLLQEYEVYQQKLNLLKKRDSHSPKKSPKKANHQDTDEFITVLDKVLQLQEEIKYWILETLKDDKRYNIDKNSLPTFIQLCSLKTNVLLQTVVEYNREDIFELVSQRKDLDVNGLGMNNVSMLEIAYKRCHIDMFKLLLQHKASPDVIASNKNSLLFCACEQGRFQEMKLLLDAGAKPLAMNADGFNPFGALVYQIRQKPDFEQLTLFLRYAPDALNQKQGKKNQKRTPLAYACEERWGVGILFFLEQGADSNIKRDDGLTSLGVCLVNNDLNLFKMILEHSKVSLKDSVDNALDIAVFLKQKKNQDTAPFIEEIRRYNDSRQLATHIPAFNDAFSRLDKAVNEQQKARAGIYNFFQNRVNKLNNAQDKDHLLSLAKP